MDGSAKLTPPWLSAYHRVSAMEGWFGQVDAQVLFEADQHQKAAGLSGGLLEIGVYKAKSLGFLGILAADGEPLYGLDLFQGDIGLPDYKAETVANLQGLGLDNVCLMKGDSRWLQMDDTIPSGSLRLAHIDGDHNHSAVLRDLRAVTPLMAAAPEAVIVMDDVPVKEWPGCWSGVSEWILRDTHDFRPFMLSPNKMYLCRRAAQRQLRSLMLSNFEPVDMDVQEVFDVHCAVISTWDHPAPPGFERIDVRPPPAPSIRRRARRTSGQRKSRAS